MVGALAMAGDIGQDDLVTFDMGGTTAKAALIEGGVISRSSEFQVGGGILTGSRLMTGAGYLVRMPAIDLAEVGAGGGSLIAIDAGGSMQVGPESAGAEPGPVCYDQGGSAPTITDANVALGYLNPHYLVGGALPIDSAKAINAMRQQIAEPLGVSVEEAAYGAHRIVASNMIRAIRAVSTERGRDPRGYTLVAFGGNGPVFGAAMAQAIAIRRVVVPPAPGLFSSFGLLTADVEHHLSRTFRALLRDLDKSALNEAWDALAGGGAPPACRRRLRRARRHDRASREPPLSRPDLRAHRRRAGRPRSTMTRSPRSKRPSARSMSAPTATVPGPKSRSSWSRSACWAAAGGPPRRRPASTTPPGQRPGPRPGAPILARTTAGARPT